MSLTSHRDASLDAKKNEITASSLDLGRKLRTLYLVTKFVTGPPKPHDLKYDALPTPDELDFLEKNDLSKGFPFDEGNLPFSFEDVSTAPLPSTQQDSLRAPSPAQAPLPLSPVSNSTRLTSSQERISPAPLPGKQESTLSLATPATATPTPPRSPKSATLTDAHSSFVPSIDVPPKDAPVPDILAAKSPAETSTVDPNDAIPATAEDVRNIPEELKPEPVKKTEHRAKVIHLPPREHQERHLRQIERAQEGARLRERREDENIGLSVSVPGADAVSSPSSTAGAYSTSTPKPPPHSPDTSPDAEYSPGDRGRLRDPTPDEDTLQIGKNGRLLDGQLDLVGVEEPSITPESQLRQEEQASRLAQQPEEGNDVSEGKAYERAPTSHKQKQKQEEICDEKMEDVPHSNSLSTDCSSTPKVPTGLSESTNGGDVDVEMQGVSPAVGRVQPLNKIANRTAIPEDPPRRITRVSSGAIRQKSVSEILGEIPRPSASQHDRRASQTQISASPFNLSFKDAMTPTEEKSKHSLVVFSKKDKATSPIRSNRYELDGYLALKGASDDPEKDYLRPLFLHQAYTPPRAPTLSDLIQGAHKTLNTSNIYANMREGLDYRILRRIYHLQNANKWSLRQMAKFPDPLPAVTHQDHLLAEMKWMRTDFREERKWKAAAARRMAEACSMYVVAPEEVRQHMKVKARIPPKPTEQMLADGMEDPPELVHSASTESGESLPDEDIPDIHSISTIAPAALFSLGYDDVVFQLDPTPAGETLLNELPLYDNKPAEPSPFSISTDATKNQVLPVSKFATGKLVPKASGPPRKRSRYDYESEDEEAATTFQPRKRSSSEVSLFLSPARRSPRHKELPPEETDVALFHSINRHLRERIHATQAFRPPSEFAMPSTQFFENRVPSQWTWDEDQKLRTSVKKFSYNWSIIAMEVQAFSQPSEFIAASERRTPWECFERWYQLEGLPNDMEKTAYFRTYRSRIDAANRTAAAQAQAVQQQMQQQGQNTVGMQIRRRPSTQPYRVERRRDSRYITMVDAIRKLARKRETALHRQQESAKAAALRKQHNEANQTRNSGIHTPQEFSRMKHERELKMQERQELYRQQLMQQQQQRNAAMQRAQIQGQQQALPNSIGQQQRTNTPTGTQGPSPPAQMTNGQPSANVPQRHPSQGMLQNGFPNGTMNGLGMNMPQAQMQAMQNQQRMTPQGSQDNLRMMMAQQRAQQQYNQSQMQHSGQTNSLAAAHLANGIQNPQMLAAALAASRAASGTPNGVASSSGTSTSPRSQHPQLGQPPPQQLSNGHTPALLYHQQQVAAQYPHFNAEQILKLANERLRGQMQRMQQTALSAASGSPAPINNPINQITYGNALPGGANGIPGGHSPTQYQQQLHRNMQQQQARLGSGSPGMSNARPGSRSATPQGQGLQLQRSASNTGLAGDDQSPRLVQAQMARP